MNESHQTLAEKRQSELRVAIASVETHVSELSNAAATVDQRSRTISDLGGSWRLVVTLLDMEAEPERRPCPFCQAPMRLLATRCVFCWKKSAPSA